MPRDGEDCYRSRSRSPAHASRDDRHHDKYDREREQRGSRRDADRDDKRSRRRSSSRTRDYRYKSRSRSVDKTRSKKPRSRSRSPRSLESEDRDRERTYRRRHGVSRSRSSERDRKHRRRRRSRSRSMSSASDSDSEEEYRRKRKGKKKEKGRRKEKKRDKKEKKKHGGSQWGKYGVISESDIFTKANEFHTWLVEERKINPETISKDQNRKEFAKFVEDYNTATLPHEKYYNMEAFDRRMTALRAGETLPPTDDSYDPQADLKALKSAHKRRAVEKESYLSKEQLQELRKVQNERVEASKMKLLGMDIKQNMGVRMDGVAFD